MSLPTTLLGVVEYLQVAVNRPDLEDEGAYTDALNKALRDTAAIHSFEQMKKKGAATLLSGGSTVALLTMDASFKELQDGRFPVYAVIGGATKVPVPVYTRDEVERLQGSFLPSPYLIFTQDDSNFQLGLIPPATAAAAYVMDVFYYAYPALLAADGDTSPLLTFYPNLILSKTLSLIFQSINDPIFESHEAVWKEELFRASGVDLRASKPRPRAATQEVAP